MRLRSGLYVAAAAATLVIAGGAQAATKSAMPKPAMPKPDKAVWAAAQAAKPDALELLKSMVDIDSGTGDTEGAAKVEAILAGRFKAMGAEVRTVATEQKGVGDSLVATFKGTGKGRILIIAHVDTVFGPGTVAKRPFSIEGERAHGPGVGDEKGGDVCAVEAIAVLKKLGFHDYGKIVFLVDASEEQGSTGARKLIAEEAKDADVEFNMEPGPPIGDTDGIDVWRKGSGSVIFTVHGRAAHAGMVPQDGRNAAVELVHQVSAFDPTVPHVGEGTTANLTLMTAGDRSNIIPEYAQATYNVRYRKPEDFAAVKAQAEAQAAKTVVPDVKVVVTGDGSFPPFYQDAAGDALTRTAQGVYAELGRKLGTHGTGGASESALSQAAGTPALDGMGFVGGDFHTDHEWIDLKTVPDRIYLTARLIQIFGARPPVKPAK